ncbi:MAG: flagellar hook-associated protein FlgK [Planctomycetes bacterium]|nr:flagellar hook-associated protein FlgK [Planctomycetota bacterium]
MTIFGFIQQSAAALRVAEIGMQIVGNNVANVNTPGYIRQELVQQTAIGLKIGHLTLGYGVRATGVVGKVDNYLTEQMRQALSELSRSQQLADTYSEYENIFQELSSEDISTSMSNFTNAFSDLANQPGSDSLRSLVIERGNSLAGDIKDFRQRMLDVGNDFDKKIRVAADEVNRLTREIAAINTRVASIEAGGTTGTEAVGLRDDRLTLLNELATYLDIRVQESPTGTATVFLGGDYLVSDGISRDVRAEQSVNEGKFNTQLIMVDTDAPLQVKGGTVGGLIESRDKVIQGTLDEFDDYVAQMIDRVNAIHSQGQGTKGFSEITSTRKVSSSSTELENAGLPRPVENGSFQIQTHDSVSGQSKTYNIPIDMDGLGSDTNLLMLVDSINNGVGGLTAAVTEDNRLSITSESETITFSFQNDTSGILNALGMNTFFTGEDSFNIAVNDVIKKDPTLLAASNEGVGRTTGNAVKLSEALDAPVAEWGGKSVRDLYEGMAVRLTQEASAVTTRNEGYRNYYSTLESKHLSISGVNLDEEAVKLINYQRAYQASSRVIATSNELLGYLMEL